MDNNNKKKDMIISHERINDLYDTTWRIEQSSAQGLANLYHMIQATLSVESETEYIKKLETLKHIVVKEFNKSKY